MLTRCAEAKTPCLSLESDGKLDGWDLAEILQKQVPAMTERKARANATAGRSATLRFAQDDRFVGWDRSRSFALLRMTKRCGDAGFPIFVAEYCDLRYCYLRIEILQIAMSKMKGSGWAGTEGAGDEAGGENPVSARGGG